MTKKTTIMSNPSSNLVLKGLRWMTDGGLMEPALVCVNKLYCGSLSQEEGMKNRKCISCRKCGES